VADPTRALRRRAVQVGDAIARVGLSRPLEAPHRSVMALLGLERDPDLTGRTVVVSGASSGIGEATAKRFAKAGAHVLLVARRVEELERVAAEIAERGGSATPMPCDLSDTDAVTALGERIVAEHGPIAIVVNNAGGSIRRPITDSFDRLHDFEGTTALNYFGPVALSLAILPTFGTRWLAPRLPRFLAAHPGVTINLGTRLKPFDFEEEGFDAAIHFGRDDWAGAGAVRLFDERLVACCAPSFQAAHPAAGARDLIGLPLLQLETRPNAWARWFAHHGVEGPVPQGMLFDQFAPMIQAVIHGLGVALLPEFLAKAELADGRLVRAFGEPVGGPEAYYLVWPAVGAWYPPLQAFRDWLVAEAADPDGEAMLPR